MLSKLLGKREEIIFEVRPGTEEEPGSWHGQYIGPNVYYRSDNHHAVVEVTAHDMSNGTRREGRAVGKQKHYGRPEKAQAEAEKFARKAAVKLGRDGANVIYNDGKPRAQEPSSIPPGAWPDPEPDSPWWAYVISVALFGFACIAFWFVTPVILYWLGFR